MAETFSIIGSIDPVENLNNSKVYIYHGRRDTTVESGMTKFQYNPKMSKHGL